MEAASANPVGLEDSSPETLVSFKCKNCGCLNAYFEGFKTARILKNGFGLHVNPYLCIQRDCYCHTGIGKVTQIMKREQMV